MTNILKKRPPCEDLVNVLGCGMSSYGSVVRCQVCRNDKLLPVLSLGNQPIVQEYLTKKTLHQPEVTYPLNIVQCARCTLVQLDYIVDPAKVFPKKYPYRTGLTNMLVKNFRALAADTETRRMFTPGDLVVDIGSNDGTLLKGFQEKGARVVGVEPTDAARDANTSGIVTIQDFFSKKSVASILKKYGTAHIVTATNVFAHINDTDQLVKNVKRLLHKNGVFISESQYLLDTLEKTEFDCIYHEHLRFYTLRAFIHLMQLHGMSVIDAERISAAGGSIRIFVKKGIHSLSARAKKILAYEKKAGLSSNVTLREFGASAHAAKRKLVALLLECKKKGSIAGLGSPARANTLLGFTHVDTSILDYVCEKKGSPKIGLYTPGTHIPVVDEEVLLKEQPPFLLILSWHIGEELMKIMRRNGYTGAFIMPLPEPRIIRK